MRPCQITYRTRGAVQPVYQRHKKKDTAMKQATKIWSSCHRKCTIVSGCEGHSSAAKHDRKECWKRLHRYGRRQPTVCLTQQPWFAQGWPQPSELLSLLRCSTGLAVTTRDIEDDCVTLQSTGLFKCALGFPLQNRADKTCVCRSCVLMTLTVDGTPLGSDVGYIYRDNAIRRSSLRTHRESYCGLHRGMQVNAVGFVCVERICVGVYPCNILSCLGHLGAFTVSRKHHRTFWLFFAKLESCSEPYGLRSSQTL
jgi:hypothetical protein